MQFYNWPLDDGSKTEPDSDVPRFEITIFGCLTHSFRGKWSNGHWVKETHSSESGLSFTLQNPPTSCIHPMA